MSISFVPAASMVGMALCVLVSIGLPIVLLVYSLQTQQGRIMPFFLGCAVFVVMAMVLESALHQIIFGAFPSLTNNLLAYALYAAAAAAVFEETGRFAAIQFLSTRNLSDHDAICYGIGHGGIEAILLVGLTNINNLATSFMINSGVLASRIAMMDPAVQQSTMSALVPLWTTPSWQFYLSAFERLCAISLQIALSCIIYAVVKRKEARKVVIPLLIHFTVDFLSVILSRTANLWITEGAVAIMTGCTVFYTNF